MKTALVVAALLLATPCLAQDQELEASGADDHEHGALLADSSGVTQCPKCGAVSTYPIKMQNGGQVITCKKCHKNFTAEVKQGEFTGRNR